VRLPLDPALSQRLPPYLTIYPAVVLSSFTGGIRVGASAALLGGFIAWSLWVRPFAHDALPHMAFVLGSYVLAMSVTVGTCGLGRLLLDDIGALEAERAKQARETVHRIKNLIAVVQAIAFKVSRHSETQEDFRRDFSNRMAGLGIAQDVLIRNAWDDADLDTIVRSALAPFLPNPALRVTGGTAVTVRAQFVAGLCLALYELATNAMKYGALFSHPGEVTVSWDIDQDRVNLTWNETSAPSERTDAPSSGLGSSLIQSALANAPGTQVRYDVANTRVLAVFEWPQ
jgi:two-component sensor histidine kinase